jgi:hypothetical protein
MKNDVTTVKRTAETFFGKDKANTLLNGNVRDLHIAYSAAHTNFRDSEASAYAALITLRNMMIKNI